jgi:hypothetical protein
MTDDTFRVRCISFKIYSLIYFRTSRPLCTKSLQEFWCLHSDSIILRLPLPFLVRRGKMWTATVAHRLSEYSDSVVSSLVVTLLDYTLSKNVPACQQGLFALLVPSCWQVWCKLLSSCNMVNEANRLATSCCHTNKLVLPTEVRYRLHVTSC